MSMPSYTFSKKLSWLLRHGAIKMNLAINSDGYVKVNDITSLPDFSGLDLPEIQKIVATDDKNRFSLMQYDSLWYIRANQGHSISVGSKINESVIYEQITDPLPYLIHGTYKKNLENIMTTGLNRMSRTHIHMTDSKDAKSGIRKTCNAIIVIDMKRAMEDGIKFYKSENGVILTNGIDGVLDAKYLKVE